MKPLARGNVDALKRLQVPLAWLLTCIVCFTVLVLPDHPDNLRAENFLRLPLELPLLALLLIVAPTQLKLPLRLVTTVVLGLILFLKIADLGTQSAFQRPFNPYLDGKMLADGWNVLSGSVGVGLAAGIIGGILLSFALVLIVSYRCMAIIGRRRPPARRTTLVLLSVLTLCAGLGLALEGRANQLPVGIEANAGSYLVDRITLIVTSIADMRSFDEELAQPDPLALPASFSALRGKDVVLIFVESYGRSAIEDPRYAPVIEPRLQSMETTLQQEGFHTASSWVTSPTVAGLSWLAHGTLLSGLWTNNQARYDRLIASNRQSLNRLFAKAGWQTVAVMPAITLDWPESAYFGYDTILAAKDLGYRGKPFNWITMPDQYTLSAFQKMIRDAPRSRPVMAEIALISSHAPWTPVPSLIDWQQVGDGSAFTPQAEAGQTPAFVWADPERVRQHYIQTIDYSLETISSFISRYGRDAVFIVLGDHQPAAIVTGQNASRAVPLHIISRDQSVTDQLIARGFEPRLKPTDSPERLMSSLRQTIVDAFERP